MLWLDGLMPLAAQNLVASNTKNNIHPIHIYTYIDSSLAYILRYCKYVPMISKHTYYVYLYMCIKHYIIYNLWPYIYINIVLYACFYGYDPWPCWGRSTHSAKRCTVSGLQSGTLALEFQNDAGDGEKMWISSAINGEFIIAGWWFGTYFFIFQYIGNNHPNWLSYFSEG